TPGTGCPGITRPAYPSTIPEESVPPYILNQRLPTAAQPQGWEEKYAPNLAPEIIFRYAASPEGHRAGAGCVRRGAGRVDV
ncbi:MAG: hypothetical protein Q7J31_15605, partial [Syntrophales bacterium]|nr:hypothetical protein [Syntrophales bacterium]